MPKTASVIAKKLIHAVSGSRKFYYGKVSLLAKDAANKKILELGSGPLMNGQYPYSAQHLFSSNNEFIKSDVIEDYGHAIIDATTMRSRNEFDIILCLNVLEHVYDYPKAIANLHKALKKGGTLVVAVPFAFPLHDEPGDYWRFTEHSLRKMFTDFQRVTIHYNGKRQAPFGYYLEATK